MRYEIYPTLLDAFHWYRKSENEEGLQEFLNKINRVKTEPTDAMLRGIAFNNKLDNPPEKWPDEVVLHDTKCPGRIMQMLSDKWAGTPRQVYVETEIATSYGTINIYGFIDAIKGDTIGEFKSTSKYEFPKYLHNWQHPCYLECLKSAGISRFVYDVTDFHNIYSEDYNYSVGDSERLVNICSELIYFLETNRNKITDKKVFGLK